MHIDRDEVRRIARLSHLEVPRVQQADGTWVEPPVHLIDDATLDLLADELGRILEHVRDLQSVDVRDVPPTRHGVMLPTRLRKDEAAETLETEAALAGAPARFGHTIAVPKVVE